MKLDFPFLTASLTPEVLVLHSERPLKMLASAVVGGGFTQAHYIINRHVIKGYSHPDPPGDLRGFAGEHGIDEPFVGLMTAAYLDRVQTVALHAGSLTVAAIVTAGLSNPTCAGLSSPAPLAAGTINIILLVDGNLSPAALVNAVITATEAKAYLLLEGGVRTPDGFPATGTSTDALVVAYTGRGETLPYAGPATRVGWLIGQCVRQTLGALI